MRVRFCSALLGLTTLATSALALDPSAAITQYGRRAWGIDNGLPQASIHAIAQTKDGYLWGGTQQGLARFDGLRFVSFPAVADSEKRRQFVSSLLADPDGSLWIGMKGGNGLLRYRDEHVSRDPRAAAAGISEIYDMERAADGAIWMATNLGLMRRNPDGTLSKPLTSAAAPNVVVRALAISDNGTLWVGWPQGVAKLVDGRLDPVTAQGRPIADVQTIYCDSTNRIWIGTGHGLWRVEPNRRTVSIVSHEFITCIREDAHRNLWIGTNDGVIRRTGERVERFTVADGLEGDFVMSVFEDAERTLWIGTVTGLTQLRDTAFRPIGKAQGLPDDLVMTVYQDPRGAMWFGTDGGLGRFEGNRVRWFTEKHGLSNRFVNSITDADGGGVWVGTWGGGICRVKDGIRCYDKKDGLSHDLVRTVLRDSRGDVWVGTWGGGLNLLHNGTITVFGEEHGLKSAFVMSISKTRTGGVWVGFLDGGLVHFDEGRVRRVIPFEGRHLPTVRNVIEEPDGSLWIATIADGLFLWRDGRMTKYPLARLGLDDYIYQIVDDEAGSIWMSSNRGVVRFLKEELLAFAEKKTNRLTPVVFGTSSGLPSSECNGGDPGAIRAADGTLWFGTTKGIAVVDPRRMPSPMQPRARIEAVETDDQITHREFRRLPPNAGRITFRFTAPAFANPEQVTFRYRLFPFEREWVRAGNSRTAVYTNLPAGKYSFEVAAGASGAIDTVTLERTPALHETPQFVVLCTAILMLALYFAYRARVAVLRRRQADLEHVVAERTANLAEANEKLRHISITDPLTGICNRRRFDEHLAEEWRRALRIGTPLSLILFDVDYFKRYNDRYGHAAGDECLTAVAQAAASAASRPGDLVARYGGEEFVVVLGSGGHAGALAVAETIRRHVASLAIPHQSSDAAGYVTVSLGVATLVPSAAEQPLVLVQRADHALYESKANGRNQVTGFAHEEPAAAIAAA